MTATDAKTYPLDPMALRIVAWIALASFSWIGWRLYREWRQLPFHDVSVDAEGIWPAHRARTGGLIRWEQIATVRQRPHLHRLGLLNGAGVHLRVCVCQ